MNKSRYAALVLALLGHIGVGLVLTFRPTLQRPPAASGSNSGSSVVRIQLSFSSKSGNADLTPITPAIPEVVVTVPYIESVTFEDISTPFIERDMPTYSSSPRVDELQTVDEDAFSRMAGLLAGESAIVVLRIEVLASGRTGRVVVDVSSGRQAVDAAAIAMAREKKWIAGVVRGEAHDAWIRIGIRLSGVNA